MTFSKHKLKYAAGEGYCVLQSSWSNDVQDDRSVRAVASKPHVQLFIVVATEKNDAVP